MHFGRFGKHAAIAYIDCANTLTIIAGSAPKREFDEAIGRARANRDLLAEKWSEFNERD